MCCASRVKKGFKYGVEYALSMSEWCVPVRYLGEALQFRKVYAPAMLSLLRSEGHGQDVRRGAIETEYASQLRLLKARKQFYFERAVATWPERAPGMLSLFRDESLWLIAAVHAKMFTVPFRYKSFSNAVEQLHVELVRPDCFTLHAGAKTRLVVEIREDDGQRWMSGTRIVEREVPLEKIVRIDTMNPSGVRRVLEDYRLDIQVFDLRVPLLEQI